MKNLMRFVKELFKCPVCQGKGEIPNPDFEACSSIPDVVPEKYRNERDPRVRCTHCRVRRECLEGEFIRCPNCKGTGHLRMGWEETYKLIEQNLDGLVDALKADGVLEEIKKE